MSRVYIGLGSNKDDRESYLNRAIHELEKLNGISIMEISPFYETLPFGVIEQPSYLNGVVLIDTELSPLELYQNVKIVEESVGRTKSFRWGPREIDLDIILFDSMVYEDDMLQIPHKDFRKRDFVLVPLLDISPELIDPITKESLSKILMNLDESYIIREIETNINQKLGTEIV